jgi:two-component sensor histidine kinase
MTEKQKDMRLDKQTETALKIIMDAAPVGIVVFGSDSRIIYGNSTASKLFGKQATEIFGLRCGDFIDCSKCPGKSQLCGQTESCTQCSLFRAICAALSDDAIEAVQEGETLLERDSGLSAIWVKYKVTTIVLKGTKVAIMVVEDITDRKQAEEAIKTSLREKETLLKELHHRVKNNMQVISSLLNLQMMRNQDERVKKALMDCRGRINSMASIHEMLYASGSLSVIDCHKYFSKLTRDILHSYHPSLQRVKLTVDAKGVTLGIQQSLPLGLMINELLSNALKYGFPENMHGHIMIHLKACEQDMLEFVFSDNGIGIPQDIDWRKTGSLGLNLIVLLAENQLGGTVSLDRAKGTRFTIKFRREEL